ncbi:MAG: hypothetical protein COW59_05920 [Lysobacterales bacterium CG17_big_fil_post_rev_8_21_14_2_50_64_11]|nr:MAG: hypothetical protein COW59_05920 [Xanthomonadales bacterium CG17_big_fil_post_rev_8_21_14_2_50_64_11]PIX60810.1 MAG: hypothetical protein COZ47_05255 [Xanthomonadales bacterium CG_4_10_14_3_um_filter_64_11]
MNPVSGESLHAQALALRQQMQVQRARIAQQLDVSAAQRSGYPRSLTMRFLVRRPAVVVHLLVELGSVLLGARVIRSLARARSLISVVRSV